MRLLLLLLAALPAVAQELRPAPARLAQTLGREYCALSLAGPGVPRGLQDGDQLRVIRADGEGLALFTVVADQGVGVRVSPLGARRLGLERADGQRLRLSRAVVATGLTEAQARSRGELIEVLLPRPRKTHDLLVLAPHGGRVEIGTDVIARALAADPRLKGRCLVWLALGFARRGAYDRWHITSTAISTRSFPLLAKATEGRRFARCVALHGHRGAEILIGGGAPDADKAAVARALADLPAKVRVVPRGGRLGGRSRRNVVNRWSARGIQLELPKTLRTKHADAVARALAAAFAAGYGHR